MILITFYSRYTTWLSLIHATARPVSEEEASLKPKYHIYLRYQTWLSLIHATARPVSEEEASLKPKYHIYLRYQTWLSLIHATARPVSEGSISETKISYLFTVPDMIITDSRHCTSCIWRKHLWNQKNIEKGHMHINRFFWSLLCYLFQTKFELVHSLTGNERDDIIYSP